MSLLVLTLVLLLGVGCSAFQCSTSPFSEKRTEYFVCPDNDSPYSEPESTNDCDYVSTLPLSHCDGTDLQTSVPLCWKVRDSDAGTVQVTFPLLSLKCNLTGYDLTLMVHEAPHCPTDEDSFSKHSWREVVTQNCLEPSCRSQCKQRGVVVFRHVFTACYQLYVTPKRHLQAYLQLVSDALAITTKYIKTPISAMHGPILNFHPASLSMQAQYALSPASSEILLSYISDVTMGVDACRNTGVSVASCITCLGSPELQCQTYKSGETVVPTCSYQDESIVKCKFSGLKPGNYCVRIQFYDDRCVADTVWNENNNDSTCIWEAQPQQFLPPERAVVEIHPHFPTINPIMLIFLAFVFIACVVTAFVVYQHLVPRQLHSPRYTPHKTFQVSERPQVLLLYARDCRPFMQAVAHLRMLMRRVYNCQVVDCWDDSQYGAVAQNPAWWLTSHLESPKTRCVFITSPASVVHEAALMHGKMVRYKHPNAFDCVPTLALSRLHDAMATLLHNSYRNLFVVRLDTGMEGALPRRRTYLNPLTTYVLPLHFNKLMAALYNLDSTVCTITTDSPSEVALLSDFVAEYRQHLKDNPGYLDDLMVSDTHTSVLHILN